MIHKITESHSNISYDNETEDLKASENINKNSSNGLSYKNNTNSRHDSENLSWRKISYNENKNLNSINTSYNKTYNNYQNERYYFFFFEKFF